MTTTALASDRPATPSDVLLPTVVGIVVYLVILVVGSHLLNDPDTYWHIVLGNWIRAHGFPTTDVFSFTFSGTHWIAKEWLSQILFAGAYELAGWPGVVALAAGAVALALGLLTAFLQKNLQLTAVLMAVAVAYLLVTAHALARPHVLALPVMVAWVGGLVRAADERRAPSYLLLLLMVLWANLHGGFTLGILLAGAVGLDAIVAAPRETRKQTAFIWIRFGVLTGIAGCITPYGPESMLVTWRILSLGPALGLIGEWAPADFSHLGAFEIVLVGAIGAALLRGVTLPWVRILILAGLLHLALSAERNSEVLGLLAPLFLAAPLARQFPPLAATGTGTGIGGRHAVLAAVLLVLLIPATVGFAALLDYQPAARMAPARAVEALKAADPGPVLNDYNFGGYLVYAGVPTFIDGRTELYGSAFTLQHHRALSLADLAGLAKLLDTYGIGATLLAPTTPAVAYLDTLPGWKRLYADDIAVVHVRREPAP